MRSDKRPEPIVAPKGPRIEERTVEATVEEMNNPPQPTPTQAEADALLEGEPASEAMGRADETDEQRREREARETPEERTAREAREKQQRDMQAANPSARYTTR